MIKTKFVFAVSMVAMMAVNVANAKIAATSYVDAGVETATNAANVAQTSANAANTAAGKAQTSADNAQEAADNAQLSADAAAASAKAANDAVALKQDKSTAVTHTANTAAGSATVPVYVNANGVATAITSYGGNAASATKATKDGSDNVITDTYEKLGNKYKTTTTTAITDSNKDALYPSIGKVQAMLATEMGVLNTNIGSANTAITALTGRVTTLETDVDTAQSTANTAQSAANTANSAIAVMDLETVGADGSYIKTVSQADGKVTAVAEAADTTPTSGSKNMITSGGVYSALGNKADKSTINALDLTAVGADGSYIKTVSQADGKVTAVAEAADTTPTSSSKKMITSGGVYTALSGKEAVSNKYKTTTTTAITDSNKDALYPSIGKVQAMLNTEMGVLNTNIGSANTAITALTGRVTTLETDVDTAQSAANTANNAIAAMDSTSSGTGAVVTGVSQTNGKVSVTMGNVKIPSGSETSTTYATIWVE